MTYRSRCLMRHSPARVTQKIIHHVIALWDECDHVSRKRSGSLSELFWAGYLAAFPEGKQTAESPAVMVTKSPLFDLSSVKSFFHEGAMVPYAGKNKDLAIAKFCTSGFIDQDENCHFIIDDFRTMRFRKGDPPMQADDSVLVAFITSDREAGMQRALEYVMSHQKSKRTNFACIQTDKTLAQGDQRMSNAGHLLGMMFKQRFIQIENGGLLLKLET